MLNFTLASDHAEHLVSDVLIARRLLWNNFASDFAEHSVSDVPSTQRLLSTGVLSDHAERSATLKPEPKFFNQIFLTLYSFGHLNTS